MSGKKKIVYQIELPFKVGNPVYFNNAEDKYVLNKDIIDQIKTALIGSLVVGYVKRDREKMPHGINAHSLNDAIREKLKTIPGIQGETNVVFGSFLPPINTKGEFDFAVFDEETNFFNLWNHCYGSEGAVHNGDEIIDIYIRDEKTRKKWDTFIEIRRPKKYGEMLSIPSDVFNIIGEIQFGNWAMVYKDMFRLVSAINKKAKIDLYIYIAADTKLQTLMSDGIVGFKDACNRFKENVDNHNINKPVMIIPFDIDFDIDTYDFSLARAGYEKVCSDIESLENKIDKKNKLIKKYLEKKKGLKGDETVAINQKITRARKEKKRLEIELKRIKNQYKEQKEFDEE